MSRSAILLLLLLSTIAFSKCDGGGGEPFAAKASLLRFWRRTLPNGHLPAFLLQKASPLNATSLALFSLYLKSRTLSDHISSFCTAAELFCPPTAARYDKASVKDEGFPTSGEFAQYGKGFNNPTLAFGSYRFNFTFKNYASNDITFKNYKAAAMEAGKFFRESMLVQTKTLPMPDIKDYMPKRSFLPASLANNLPFSTQTLPELMKMFHVPENSTMSAIMVRTLRECERAAVKGEIKKCVKSVEGMAEFAVSVLGSNVEILTTQSTAGSGGQVYVGAVTGKDGGKITRSVSCHQSLFPFLVYYCHSVPKVKVYEAALLSMKEKKKINEGVAICHMDTRQWSAKHAAFVELGYKAGEIEVCHWIFENDLIWVPLPA